MEAVRRVEGSGLRAPGWLGVASLGIGFGILTYFIASWWNKTEVAAGGLKLLIGLGFLLGAIGIARIANLTLNFKGLLGFIPAALTLLLGVVTTEALLRAYQVPTGLIPTPSRVLTTLWQTRDVLLADAWQTFVLEAVIGFILGSLIGLGLAYLFSRFKFLERGLMPYATAFSSIPIVALAPVIIKMIGLEWTSKAAIVAITVIFPVAVNTFRGLTEVSPLSLDLMRSYGATQGQQYAALCIPNALPFVFNALKIGTTLAMISAIVGEFFGATGSGLGFRIQIEAGRFGFDIVWSAIIIASVLGIAWYNLMSWLERRLTGWHVSFREG